MKETRQVKRPQGTLRAFMVELTQLYPDLLPEGHLAQLPQRQLSVEDAFAQGHLRKRGIKSAQSGGPGTGH